MPEGEARTPEQARVRLADHGLRAVKIKDGACLGLTAGRGQNFVLVPAAGDFNSGKRRGNPDQDADHQGKRSATHAQIVHGGEV